MARPIGLAMRKSLSAGQVMKIAFSFRKKRAPTVGAAVNYPTFTVATNLPREAIRHPIASFLKNFVIDCMPAHQINLQNTKIILYIVCFCKH